MNRLRPRTSALVACLALLLSAACGTVPDIGPFVTATDELNVAVSASGTAVVQELERIPFAKEQAPKLQKEWEARRSAMTALATYAHSLQEIVAAGQSGTAAVEKLSGAVAEVATAVGYPLAEAGVSTVTDVAKFLFRQWQSHKTLDSLEEALVESQPIIDGIAEKIGKDMVDLDVTLRSAERQVVQGRKIKHEVKDKFRTSLEGQRDGIYKKEAAKLTDEDKKQLKEIDQLLKGTDVWYEPLEKKLAGDLKRVKAARNIVASTRSALTQWAAGHRQLAVAIQKRSPPDLSLLLKTAMEIQKLTERLREL